MSISLYGVLFAALFLAFGLAQWVFLKKMFARGLEEQRASLPAEEFARRQAGHATILKVTLLVDLLVLPAAGYYVGTIVFGK